MNAEMILRFLCFLISIPIPIPISVYTLMLFCVRFQEPSGASLGCLVRFKE
jgi:hypothetical protein